MTMKYKKFRCDRNCFCCPFPDCTLRGDARMTEFEILCMTIAHPNENPETIRQRRNSQSLERYYRKKAQKSKE